MAVHGLDTGVDMRARWSWLWIPIALGGIVLAMFLVAGHDSFSHSPDTSSGAYRLPDKSSGAYHLPDKSSDAYHIGYSELFLATGGQAGALRHDPNYNPYLTMPRSQWDAYAEERYGDSTGEAECDPFTVGTGDWSDYGAGANQALQDIASGHKPRMHLVSIDPDCD